MKAKHPPCVAITGASGFLGSALVKHFLDKGWSVKALVRTPGQGKKNLTYVNFDLASAIDSGVLKGADYLIHTAYIKQDAQHPDAHTINVEAARKLSKVANANRLKKCIFMSSMSAHEQAESSYGRQKLEIEKLFSGKNSVSIRSGLIIGNGGIVKQMVGFMRSKHAVPLVGGGTQPLQIVGIDDLVHAIDKLLASDLSGTYTVATPRVYSYKEFYRVLSQHLGIKVLFVPLPLSMLMAMVSLVELLHLPLAVNKDNVLGLKKLSSVETSADLERIGIHLHSLEEALANIDV